MNKTNILVELHGVIATRLFGGGPWLMNRNSAAAYRSRATELGLEEQTGDYGPRHTPLGKAIDFDLLLIFMGGWDHRDIPIILEQRSLITKAEADAIYEEWAKCKDPEVAMKSYVQKAYVRCFRPRKGFA